MIFFPTGSIREAGNHVAGKLLTHELPGGVLNRRERIEHQRNTGGGEVSRAESRAWDRADVSLALPDTLPLIIEKEKCLRIFRARVHAAADKTPELVQAKLGDRQDLAVEVVLGVEVGVAQKFEQPAMIILSAGLVSKIDRASAPASELRVGDRNLDAKLLHRVDDGEDQNAQPVMVLVV